MKFFRKSVILFLSSVSMGAAVETTTDAGIRFTLENMWDLKNTTVVNPPLTKYLGGMFFSDDGTDLFIVDNSERTDAELIRLPLIRNSTTNKIIGLAGTSESITSISKLDLLRKNSNSDILYSVFTANKFGRATYNEGTKAFTTVQNITLVKGTGTGWGCYTNDVTSTASCYNVAPYGFSYHRNITDPNDSTRKMMMVSADYGIWMVPYNVNGTTGDYEFGGSAGEAQFFCELEPEYPGDMITIPSGSLIGDIMYIDWDYGHLKVIDVDSASGHPIDKNTGLPDLGTNVPNVTIWATFPSNSAPWGMIFDPITNDILISSWESSTAFLYHFSGFPPGVDINHINAQIQQRVNEALGTTRRVRRHNLRKLGWGNNVIQTLSTCGSAFGTSCKCELCELDGECNGILVDRAHKHKSGLKDKCINSTEIKDGDIGYGGSCVLDDCESISIEDLTIEQPIPTPEEIVDEIAENPQVITETLDTIFENPSTAAVISGDTGANDEAFEAALDNISDALDLLKTSSTISGDPTKVAKLDEAKGLVQLLKNIKEFKI